MKLATVTIEKLDDGRVVAHVDNGTGATARIELRTYLVHHDRVELETVVWLTVKGIGHVDLRTGDVIVRDRKPD